ncbi:MAG: hypothetical protein AB7R55_13535, partial [Gemmatimonadales bacterium]
MRFLAGVLAAILAVPAHAQTPVHPLDGLSAREHWALYQTLRASGRLDSTARFLYAGLEEPAKATVAAWRPGTPFGRRAKVHLVQSNKGYEAVVDLQAGQVVELRQVTDRQYMADDGEAGEAITALLAHPDFHAGLLRRGITDFAMVQCFPINHGYFDRPEERGHRLARVSCWNRIGSISGWGVPLSGLVGVVDLQSGKVIRVLDDGSGAIVAPAMGEHNDEAVGGTRAPLPPIVVSQPMGAGFTLNGHEVSWDGWRFHFRVDPRRGLVLSQIRHRDGNRERSILYQASLSELFVPYMDPSEPWSHQSYYDLGTYPSSFGGIASSLEPGGDCPTYATYFDTYVIAPDGSPFQRARVACLFERPGAEPAWRNGRGSVTESRARRDLVLRMVMGAG